MSGRSICGLGYFTTYIARGQIVGSKQRRKRMSKTEEEGRRMSSGREPRVVGRREGGRARLDGWMDDNSFHLWWWCVHVA